MQDENKNEIEIEKEEKATRSKRKNRNSLLRVIVRIVLWAVVIVVIAYFALFLSARIAGFDSVIALLRHVIDYL